MTGDGAHDEVIISGAVDEHILVVGRANVSRAISGFFKSRLLRRRYAGYATNRANRGGGRHADYVIEPAALSALGNPCADSAARSEPRQRSALLGLKMSQAALSWATLSTTVSLVAHTDGRT